MDIKKAKKNLFTSLGGCSIDPILHLSSIASKTENREIKELITRFSVFIEQRAPLLSTLQCSLERRAVEGAGADGSGS